MFELVAAGTLRKMPVEHAQPVRYSLQLGETSIALNELVGKTLRLRFNQHIECIHCGRKTKKSFSQGYCYPCFQRLAQCDTCIMSPERCHYAAGTCREPAWADEFCMTDHVVYLANSSGIKVGLTRINQIPTRWIDQGAISALPIFRVATRQQAGFVEDALRQYVPDKTNWRKLLKGEVEFIDLLAERDKLLELAAPAIRKLQESCGLQSIQPIDVDEVYEFDFPVREFLKKVKTYNLDKEPELEDTLLGIKGQYLLFEQGAINIRKYGGYHIELFCR